MKLKEKDNQEKKKTSGLEPTFFWKIAEDIPPNLSSLMIFLSIFIPLLCWFLFTNYSAINPKFLPSPSDVVTAIIRLWQKGFLTEDIAASFSRVSLGFFLSTLVAIPLGIMMGSFASIRALFEPIIGILRYMPAPAFIPK